MIITKQLAQKTHNYFPLRLKEYWKSLKVDKYFLESLANLDSNPLLPSLYDQLTKDKYELGIDHPQLLAYHPKTLEVKQNVGAPLYPRVFTVDRLEDGMIKLQGHDKAMFNRDGFSLFPVRSHWYGFRLATFEHWGY